jgi:hypothetical protein
MEKKEVSLKSLLRDPQGVAHLKLSGEKIETVVDLQPIIIYSNGTNVKRYLAALDILKVEYYLNPNPTKAISGFSVDLKRTKINSIY